MHHTTRNIRQYVWLIFVMALAACSENKKSEQADEPVKPKVEVQLISQSEPPSGAVPSFGEDALPQSRQLKSRYDYQEVKSLASELALETNPIQWLQNLDFMIEVGLRGGTRNTWDGLSVFFERTFENRSLTDGYALLAAIGDSTRKRISNELHSVEGISQWNFITGSLMRKARGEQGAAGLDTLRDLVNASKNEEFKTSILAYMNYAKLPQDYDKAMEQLSVQPEDRARTATEGMLLQREAKFNPPKVVQRFLEADSKLSADPRIIAAAFQKEQFFGNEAAISTAIRDAPSSDRKDLAIAALARVLVRNDPEGAQTWSDSIQNNTIRQQSEAYLRTMKARAAKPKATP